MTTKTRLLSLASAALLASVAVPIAAADTIHPDPPAPINVTMGSTFGDTINVTWSGLYLRNCDLPLARQLPGLPCDAPVIASPSAPLAPKATFLHVHGHLYYNTLTGKIVHR